MSERTERLRGTGWLALTYVMAVTVTLAITGRYGEVASVIDSFFGIGLVIAIRDRFHERLGHDAYWPLTGLVLLGAVSAFAVNLHTPHIGLASVEAFIVANVAACIAWVTLENGWATAAVFALVDSFVFPPLAFGHFVWWVVIGQVVCKLAGAVAYGWLLRWAWA